MNSINNCYIYLIIILIFLSEIETQNLSSLLVRPVIHRKHDLAPMIGINVQKSLNEPLYYDTIHTFVVEVDLPNWTVSDLHVDFPHIISNVSLFCDNFTTSSDLWAQGICPVIKQLNNLLDTFTSQMRPANTFNSTAAKLDTTHFTSCHDIKPHFTNHLIDQMDLNLYLIESLMHCAMADVQHIKYSPPTVDKTKYAKILKSFIDTHISPKYRMSGYTKYAISTNTLLSMHSLKLMDYLLDSQQWSSAVHTCNTQRIPEFLFPRDKLEAMLKEVEDFLPTNGFNFTIPISHLANYYKYQIADCVLTSKGTYVVRALIPLTKLSANYKTITIKSVPFLNLEPHTRETTICHHRVIEGNIVVEGDGRVPVARLQCEDAHLCRVPPVGERPLFSKCLLAAISNNSKEMFDSCHLTCMGYDPSFLPYIKRMSPDQFVIVGTSSADIAVICKGQTDPIRLLDIPKEQGSMIVTVPCFCYLSHRSDKYFVEGPCGIHLETKPIEPKLTKDMLALLAASHHHDEPTLTNTTDSKQAEDEAESSEERSMLALADDIYFEPRRAEIPSKWPIYLAFTFILIIVTVIIFGLYVVRNVYIRIGLLELAIAKRSLNMQTEFNVQYSARANDGDVY